MEHTGNVGIACHVRVCHRHLPALCHPQSSYGAFLEQIAYDHDNNPDTPDLVGAVKKFTDENDAYFYDLGTSWMLLAGDGATFPRDEVAETPNGMSIQTVQDGGWLCWRICTYATTYAKPDFAFVDYYVNTESLVPAEHLLCKIDAAINWNKLYDIVEPLYCEDHGRPSIDPVVLFKKGYDFKKDYNRKAHSAINNYRQTERIASFIFGEKIFVPTPKEKQSILSIFGEDALS